MQTSNSLISLTISCLITSLILTEQSCWAAEKQGILPEIWLEAEPYLEMAANETERYQSSSIGQPGSTGSQRLISHSQSWSEFTNRAIAAIGEDHANFYTWDTLIKVGAGLAVAGPIANTDADQEFRDWFQQDVRSGASNDFSDFTEYFGAGYVTLPALVGAAIVGRYLNEDMGGSLISEWSERSLRGLLVGAAPITLCQGLLGAPRPGEGPSDWDPFNDRNSCSGHTYMGAVPFLTAASMTDNIWLKSAWYLGSIATGFSRINTDNHYLSQVILGWWFAYLSVSAVDKTENKLNTISFAPAFYPDDKDAVGLNIAIKF